MTKINLFYEILEDKKNKKNLCVYQKDFDKGKMAGRMAYVNLGQETKSELIEKGIKKFIEDYKITTTFNFTIKKLDSNDDHLCGIVIKEKGKLSFDYLFHSNNKTPKYIM